MCINTGIQNSSCWTIDLFFCVFHYLIVFHYIVIFFVRKVIHFFHFFLSLTIYFSRLILKCISQFPFKKFPGVLLMVKVKVAQSCLTPCESMDCIVHGILQARILERVAFPFSSRSSQTKNQTRVSCIAGIFFTSWVTREALNSTDLRTVDSFSALLRHNVHITWCKFKVQKMIW